MGAESKYLLKLLGAFVSGQAVEADEGIDWGKLCYLAQLHSVTGILGYMAMRHPICPDAAVKTQLRRLCLGTIELYARRYEQAKALLAALEEQGIACCAMKGLIVRDAYPVPELRTFNDVDFLIGLKDREACHRWMLAQGFTAGDDWEPVYSYRRGMEYYEIHSRLMEVDVSGGADYRGYFDRAWDYAQEAGDGLRQLKKEFHFLYLLTHIAKHVAGAGAGVRMYLDIAAFIKKWGRELDWGWIFGELEGLGLLDFGCTVLTAAEAWFGVTCPAEFERKPSELMERFLEFTVEAGTFGHHERDAGVTALKKSDGSRASVLLRRLFPKAETIESRYTYLQGRHYLLPVAWVHRLFKTDVGLKDHAREARSILTAEETQVRRLQEICRDIGL